MGIHWRGKTMHWPSKTTETWDPAEGGVSEERWDRADVHIKVAWLPVPSSAELCTVCHQS